ncbi:MAG TPA: transaldolase family protein [Anaerolineales bacterium]|nr:transaldolase family protein [Anaerolineales bacterium]
MTNYKSPLHQTVSTTVTDYWNDSCSIEELTYAIGHGAVGATSNPTIVLSVIKKEIHLWRDRIAEIIVQNPTWSEVDVTWKVFEEVGVKGAEQLLPVFEREAGKKGRLSIQTNPANYRTADAILAQALHFDSLAPNIQVKAPVTKAGLKAIEEATCQGININATVCFSVPQSIAVAEAVERGLDRRTAAGHDISQMSPVCTIMVGRVDDWMQTLAERDGIIVNPDYLVWPGIAVFKKAYQLYQERGYKARLLAAAYRHHLHWSELIGGDVILTIPYEWQLRFNASDIEVKERMHIPVAPEIIDGLYRNFPDFRMAYDEDGMTVDEFDTYGANVRTLRGFIKSYHDLQALIREEYMLPNPDVK